jgi:hypothetical protein
MPWHEEYGQLRHSGYYKVYAFVPEASDASKAKTDNARYEVYHNYATTVVPVNQNAYNNAWVHLGTYTFHPDMSCVSLTDYTGGSGRRVVADAVKFTASIVYLPDVKNTGGWMSSIIIRNNSTSSAQAAINYYNASGARVSYQTTTVAGNGFKTKTPPAGFAGSAVVVASEDVAVVVENEANNHTERTNYTGILPNGGSGSPGWEQAGVTLYAPVVKRQYYSRSSTLRVVNAGSQATTVYVYYYDDGGVARSGGSYGLNPNGMATISPSGGGSGGCNAANTVCSARLYTSNGQPLAGVVREYDDADGLAVTTHNMFSAGATTIDFPIVKYEWYNMSTGLQIQNVGASGTTVEVDYYRENGSWVCSRTKYLSRYASKTFFGVVVRGATLTAAP